jgi:hypothetical protein
MLAAAQEDISAHLVRALGSSRGGIIVHHAAPFINHVAISRTRQSIRFRNALKADAKSAHGHMTPLAKSAITPLAVRAGSW